MPVLIALGGCDPCGFTIGCERAPAIVVVGHILDEDTGRPVARTRVAVRVDSGVATGQDESITGADGGFELELRAGAVGPAFVTVEVSRPGKPSYRRPDIATAATSLAGDAVVLPPWLDARPRFSYVIVTFAGIPSAGVPGVELEFQRTGGQVMYSDSGIVERVVGATGENGWSFLMSGLWTDVVGDVIGDLTVRAPGDATPRTIRGASFRSSELYRPPFAFITIPVS